VLETTDSRSPSKLFHCYTYAYIYLRVRRKNEKKDKDGEQCSFRAIVSSEHMVERTIIIFTDSLCSNKGIQEDHCKDSIVQTSIKAGEIDLELGKCPKMWFVRGSGSKAEEVERNLATLQVLL
jgi:hypothetical protein